MQAAKKRSLNFSTVIAAKFGDNVPYRKVTHVMGKNILGLSFRDFGEHGAGGFENDFCG